MVRRSFITGILVVLFAGCDTTGGYKPVAEQLPQLNISFADPAWDGKTVPAGQHCSLFGGQGATPALVVENPPARANAIIVEFNDRSYPPLSRDGGHGKIGFWITPTAKVTLPSVPGEKAALPEGTFVEAASRSRGKYATRGYLPPCSGGRGNSYFAVVKAVYKAKSGDEVSLLLAKSQIELGRY